MDSDVSKFVTNWMRDNAHVLEEIILLQGDNPNSAYGEALEHYFKVAPAWPHRRVPDTSENDSTREIAPHQSRRVD